MNIEEIRDLSLAKSRVLEGFPFGGYTLILKVMNTLHALVGFNEKPPFLNFNCDPERAVELREE